MDRMRIQEAFVVLKPLCDTLCVKPNKENLDKITDCVQHLSSRIVQDVFSYVLFPITLHLQNDEMSLKMKEDLINALKIVLSKTKVTNFKQFYNIYACVLIVIYDKQHPSELISSHEELKEAVVHCLRTLLNQCSIDIIEHLYTRNNAPKIAQGMYTCITLARQEKSRSLRLAAINTIMTLCQLDTKNDENDIVMRAQVADVIMLLLPGIVSGLVEIATESEIQGHKVPMIALDAWAKVTSLVMEDSDDMDKPLSLEMINTEAPIISTPNKNKRTVEEILKSTVRDEAWLNAAATKFNVLIKELDLLLKHPHYKVRKQLCTSIGLVLSKCPRNMKPNNVELFEYLVSLSEDDDDDVKAEAEKVLNCVRKVIIEKSDLKFITDILEENFFTLITKLPRVIRTSGDADQLICLNQIAGYMKLFKKERLSLILSSSMHFQKIMLALVYAIEIEYNDISVLEDVSIKDWDDLANTRSSNLWTNFKFIFDNRCREKISFICELFGRYGDLRILIDNILVLMRDAEQYRKELIVLLNWMLQKNNPDKSLMSYYKALINYYTDDNVWYLPTKVNKDTPLYLAQNNIVQSCLLTEGLGVIASHLKMDYSIFLQRTLFLVTERAGSAHPLISSAGIKTLETIATSQQQASINSLLCDNMDYITFYISTKLHKVEHNPGVLDVIETVIKYSSIDVFSCLSFVIEDVLSQLNRRYNNRSTYLFLKLFYTFVLSTKRMISSEENNDQSKCKIEQDDPVEVIVQEISKYYEEKQTNKNLSESTNETTDIDDINEEENDDNNYDEGDNLQFDQKNEENENRPAYIKIVEDILKRCLHYVPSKDVDSSLIALRTLQEGIPLLIKYEDQLLPIVHQVWHPLVTKFEDSNVLIMNEAWELLCVLAFASQDFIRMRTLRQVLPSISKFLAKSFKGSFKKQSTDIYRFTQVYKLQKNLLSKLGKVCKNLKLRERELWDVLTAVEPYLSSQQNLILQTCSINLYKEIADEYSDLIWAKCLAIWASKVTSIPADATFNTILLQIPDTPSAKEYSKNVAAIISYIEENHDFVNY